MMVRNKVAQTFESARRQAGKPAPQQLHHLPILAPFLRFAVPSGGSISMSVGVLSGEASLHWPFKL